MRTKKNEKHPKATTKLDLGMIRQGVTKLVKRRNAIEIVVGVATRGPRIVQLKDDPQLTNRVLTETKSMTAVIGIRNGNVKAEAIADNAMIPVRVPPDDLLLLKRNNSDEGARRPRARDAHHNVIKNKNGSNGSDKLKRSRPRRPLRAMKRTGNLASSRLLSK